MSARDLKGVLVLLLTVLPGCGDGYFVGPMVESNPPSPLNLEVVPIALDTIEMRILEVPGPLASGSLIVHGVTSESNWRANRSHLRARISVRTSAGDGEQFLMGQTLCKTDTHYSCSQFVVVTYNPERIADLQRRVEALPGGARWTLPRLCSGGEGCFPVTPSLPTIVVDVFGNDLGTAMAIARGWPDLLEIHPNYVGLLWDPTTLPTYYQGGLPLAVGAAVPDNGVLEVASGDTVTVEYTTPDGTVLRDWREAVF